MKKLRIVAPLLIFGWGAPHAWGFQAQPVPLPEDQNLSPQMNIGGVGIGTVGLGKTSDHDAESGINLSDSALLIDASERLYDGAIGSFGIGAVSTDALNRGTSGFTPYFIHQTFLDYQSSNLEVLIGRSDSQTAHLVDFPTLRGDDLITLTNPLDPYANGLNSEEHRYAQVASFTLNQNLSYYENVHVQHLINSAGIGTNTGINSVGATFQFMAPPGLDAFSRVPFFGAGYEYVSLFNNAGGLHELFAGAVVNLRESVTNRVDVRIQDILSLGSQLSTLTTVTDSFQADSHSLAVAVRYLNRAFGRPGYQLSLTGAFKNYLKVIPAKSFGLALTAVKRLGQGFDLVAQYQAQQRDAVLAAVQTNGVIYEQIGEVGFVFNFDSVINPHLSPRRSLLNQQHQYISE